MYIDIYFREANSFPTANCELQGYCVYYPSDIPHFQLGMFSHVTRLEQSRAGENITHHFRSMSRGGGVEGGGRKALFVG